MPDLPRLTPEAERKDERGWPVRMVDGVRVCAYPDCFAGPSEETSIEFGILGYCSSHCRHVHTLEGEIDALRAENASIRTWAGLMSVLDEHYPPDVIDGSSGDPGPRIVVLTRELDKLRAELAAEKVWKVESIPRWADEQMLTRNEELTTQVERLRAENEDLALERSVWCDAPDDRLYHAEDGTWWRRDEHGLCVSAEPPEEVRALHVQLNEAADLRLAADSAMFEAGRAEGLAAAREDSARLDSGRIAVTDLTGATVEHVSIDLRKAIDKSIEWNRAAIDDARAKEGK